MDRFPDEPNDIERLSRREEWTESHFRNQNRGQLWKSKLLLGATVIGGIALGTVLFLFFLTVFVYFIVPLLIILSIWMAFRRWRSGR